MFPLSNLGALSAPSVVAQMTCWNYFESFYGGGTCTHMIQSLSLGCNATFCEDCIYAGYCDQACGYCKSGPAPKIPTAPNVTAAHGANSSVVVTFDAADDPTAETVSEFVALFSPGATREVGGAAPPGGAMEVRGKIEDVCEKPAEKTGCTRATPTASHLGYA